LSCVLLLATTLRWNSHSYLLSRSTYYREYGQQWISMYEFAVYKFQVKKKMSCRCRSIFYSIKHSVNQTTSQSISQLINQPTKQLINQLLTTQSIHLLFSMYASMCCWIALLTKILNDTAITSNCSMSDILYRDIANYIYIDVMYLNQW